MEAIKIEKTNEVQMAIVGVILCLLQRGIREEWLKTHIPSSSGVLYSNPKFGTWSLSFVASFSSS